jgi:hypothetical protein
MFVIGFNLCCAGMSADIGIQIKKKIKIRMQQCIIFFLFENKIYKRYAINILDNPKNVLKKLSYLLLGPKI